MALKDTLKRAFLPVALAVTGAFASPAYAVEMGSDGCLPPAKLMAQLQAEGQGSVIVGNRIVPKSANNPEETTVFTFSTALKSGEVGKGYSFEADKPNGAPNFKFCLSGEYNRARALDVSIAEVPDGVSTSSNLSKTINFYIKEKGFNPIFYGEKNGSITVVVGSPVKKNQLNGMILLGNNDPERPAGDQGGLMSLGYSPSYLQSIASIRSPQVVAAANVQPKP